MSLFQCTPSFLIIGAQKAATSSLYSYLIQHPNLVPAKNKEVNFFNVDSNYYQGKKWYHAQFHRYINPLKRHVTLEATPEYLYIPFVAERIAKYNPNMKFIVVFREPVSRAYSAWNMFRKLHASGKVPSVIEKSYIENIPNNLKEILFAKEYPSFEEVVKLEMKYMEEKNAPLEPSFLRRGIYVTQLEQYFKYFKQEQFLFLEFNEATKELPLTLHKISTFLQLPDYQWQNLDLTIANQGNYEEKKAPMAEQLAQFYAPHNQKLFQLIHQKYDWS
jgi:hypothetical protein